MKYTNEDLENIIALCDQEESKEYERLKERCEKALAYRDIGIRITKKDIKILNALYDLSMDESAKMTLEKISQ